MCVFCVGAYVHVQLYVYVPDVKGDTTRPEKRCHVKKLAYCGLAYVFVHVFAPVYMRVCISVFSRTCVCA